MRSGEQRRIGTIIKNDFVDLIPVALAPLMAWVTDSSVCISKALFETELYVQSII